MISTQEAPFTIYKLSNGLRVIHQHTEQGSIAHCGILMPAGTRNETKSKEGLAHFLEHVLFKGTKKRSALQIINRLEVHGGELNAYTSKEETCIHASVQKNQLPQALELISDILFNSIFPKQEIEKEKDVVLEEIRMYMDNPAEQVNDDFEAMLFRNHTMGHPILGTIESVKSFSRKDVLDFISRHYHPQQMVLSITGNIDISQYQLLIEKCFCRKQTIQLNGKIYPFKRNRPFKVTATRPTEQAHIVIGNAAYSLHHKHRLHLLLLTNILGGPAMNSLLNIEVREKRGLTYGIEANYIAYSDTGIFNIYFGTEPGLKEKTTAVVFQVLQSLCSKPISDIKLKQAKNQLIGQMLMAQEHRAGVMLAIGRTLLNFSKVEKLETIFEKINSISAAELRKVANDIFAKNKLSILEYLPE
ncbi:MAG: insulinase family protein [Bacteroidetes bacterium]|nr:insulinase family protein [Bacteroidota bacterium]